MNAPRRTSPRGACWPASSWSRRWAAAGAATTTRKTEARATHAPRMKRMWRAQTRDRGWYDLCWALLHTPGGFMRIGPFSFPFLVPVLVVISTSAATPARADIPPADTPTAPDQPCQNAGAIVGPGHPGTCVTATCMKYLRGADGGLTPMTYDCSRCEAPAGGTAGADGTAGAAGHAAGGAGGAAGG